MLSASRRYSPATFHSMRLAQGLRGAWLTEVSADACATGGVKHEAVIAFALGPSADF